MIITRHFLDFAPERLPLTFSAFGRKYQWLDVWRVHVFGRDHSFPGPDPSFDRLLLEILNQRLDAQLAHLERILEDDALDRPLSQPGDDRLAGVKTDKVDTFARAPGPRSRWPR